MPKTLTVVEPIYQWKCLDENFPTVAGQLTNGDRHIQLAGAGFGNSANITNGILSVLINVAPKIFKMRYLDIQDSSIGKIRVKPLTEYRCRVYLEVTAAALSPTGANLSIIEIASNGAAITTTNVMAPQAVVGNGQLYNLDFITGAQTQFINPVFTVDGGLSGTISCNFKNFEFYER